MSDVSEIQVDDVPCLSGTLEDPVSGAWVAQVTARGDARTFARGDEVTLTLMGKARRGTVVQGGNPDLRNVLRIRGGAGKLGTVLEASDYSGVDLSYVVGDVLRSAGERVGDLSALRGVALAHWLRPAERASRALRRLLRLCPRGTYVRTLPDGSWCAQTPSWETVGASADSLRVQSWEAEDAVALYGDPDLIPEPGTSLSLLGGARRIDRVQWSWEEGSPAVRAVCWFRGSDPDGPRERLRASVAKIVWEVLAEDGAADFGRLYAGRVARDTSGDRCEVFFEDDRNRLRYVSDVRIRREVGDAVRWARGTRVLVGWDFGDERYPFALSASWSGGGGLVDRSTTFSGAVTFDGPIFRHRGTPSPLVAAVAPWIVDVEGDHRRVHDYGGGVPPTATPANPNVEDVQVTGNDLRMTVRFTVKNSPIPPGAPIVSVVYGQPWGASAPPTPVGFAANGAGLTFQATTATGTTVLLGSAAPTPGIPLGPSSVVVDSRG